MNLLCVMLTQCKTYRYNANVFRVLSMALSAHSGCFVGDCLLLTVNAIISNSNREAYLNKTQIEYSINAIILNN